MSATLFVRFDVRNNLEVGASEVRLAEKADHLLFGEAEPHVPLLVAKPFVTVSVEIDDDERSARAKNARHLFDGGARIGRVMQDERGERGVDALVFER